LANFAVPPWLSPERVLYVKNAPCTR
jgi:hypothetical protein